MCSFRTMVSWILFAVWAGLQGLWAGESFQNLGGGKAISLEALPDSALRRGIQGLGPQAKAKALAKLGSFSFGSQDLAALGVDPEGGIFFTCFSNCTVPHQEHSHQGIQTVLAGPSVPVATPPVFHSRSGAVRQIVLVFSGRVVSDTIWNSSANVASWDCLPYDLDGDPTTFSAEEQSEIAEIWRRVSEDYSPFDVDVTTEMPSALSNTCGLVLITKTTDRAGKALPANTAGGIAYVGVFGNGDYQRYRPAFVYYNNLGGGQAEYVAEACSHEMGHNLGLGHDGTQGGTAYYCGHGSGTGSWAPIMGNSYSAYITQWSKGEYANANNLEDDVAIIAGRCPRRSDDYGNTIAAASALVMQNGLVVVGDPGNRGVIEGSDDVDVFSFECAAGPVSFTVSPWISAVRPQGGNLDVRLRLCDGAGNVLSESNSETQTIATVERSLEAGRYFLMVSGSGRGTTTNGYSHYGSLGQYSVSGTVTPPPAGRIGFAVSAYNVATTGTTMISVEVPVMRTGGSNGSVSVYYRTMGDTAVAGVDFVAAEGFLHWTNGDAVAKTISVSVQGAAEEKSLRIVLSNSNGAELATESTSLTIVKGEVAGQGGLPAPWCFTAIGTGAAAGSALHQGTQGAGEGLSMSGIGTGDAHDLRRGADAFHYTYQSLEGEGMIIARLVSQSNTNDWAKAGIMIREKLTAGSPHASVVVTPSMGVQFERRIQDSGPSSVTTGSRPTSTPTARWLKLQRIGNTINASESINGVDWSSIGSSIAPQSTSILIGLFLSTHADGVSGTAIFDSVVLRPIGAG